VLHALTAALATIAAAVTPPAGGSRPSAARAATAGCVRANVSGQIECLAPGHLCLTRHERVYRFYGLTCVAARRGGAYRLQQRTFIGPPLPSAPGRA
jgi:hypothetical protein